MRAYTEQWGIQQDTDFVAYIFNVNVTYKLHLNLNILSA